MVVLSVRARDWIPSQARYKTGWCWVRSRLVTGLREACLEHYGNLNWCEEVRGIDWEEWRLTLWGTMEEGDLSYGEFNS